MALFHPQLGEKGERVLIHKPNKATHEHTWADNSVTASFTPFSSSPFTAGNFKLSSHSFNEPTLRVDGHDRVAAGAIVIHTDGRFWVASPTNQFYYVNTFPKGGHEGDCLRFTAQREVYEELGISCRILDHLCDQTRGKSLIRWYTALYTGGCPTQMGWESQAAHLVPFNQLRNFVERDSDKELVDMLQTKFKLAVA